MADQRVRTIIEGAREEIERAATRRDLDEVRVKYLGKRGVLTQLLRALPGLPVDERPVVGREANDAKTGIEAELAARQAVLDGAERRARLAADQPDVTLPGRRVVPGARHPLTQVHDEIVDVFRGLGFAVAEGPEVEHDYYNFEALNFPPDHPARDMQDTFYVDATGVLLRTHTSPVQIRVMETQQAAGARRRARARVYRRDSRRHALADVPPGRGLRASTSASPWPTSRATLARVRQRALRRRTRRMRFRPQLLPVHRAERRGRHRAASLCGGDGGRAASARAPAGSRSWAPAWWTRTSSRPSATTRRRCTGFAFGMGIERIAMLRYGIDDIRLFFENDLRFLQQF